MNGIFGEFLNLAFPFIHQGNTEIGCAEPMPPERRILQQYGTEVAILCVIVHGIDIVTAPDHQSFTGEQVGIGIKLVI